jgi:hypothetical protein
MTEDVRWKKEYNLMQEHNMLLSQIRNELTRIANHMAGIPADPFVESEENDEAPKEENDDSI